MQWLSFLDWAVFFGILGLTFALVAYGNRRLKKIKEESSAVMDYLLMGRQLTLPLFVATLVATWYGGIFGVTQIAFEKGVFNFVTQGFFWYLAYVVFALFLVKKVRAYNSVTLPDLVHSMFGVWSSRLSALFNFFNVLPIAYIISLGLFIQLLFGISLFASMAMGVLCVLIYSMNGGFRAVVFSDAVQFFVMCSAVFIVVVFSVLNFGGISFLKSHLPATHFSFTSDQSLGATLVWGLIAFSALVDPGFYQRCFAAKSEKVASTGILISTVIWFLFDICTTLGGMYARAVLPNADSGKAYFYYAVQLLPDGLRGFFLAGVLATILSTLEAYLFIAGTTISFDLLPEKFRGRRWIHRISFLGVGALTLLLASLFEGNIRLVWQTVGSYMAACLLLPILFGYFFPKRISDLQFVGVCFVGVIATTFWKWSNLDAIYIGVFATSITILLILVAQRILPGVVKSVPFKNSNDLR